ncbi:EAL domain-containing protein [Pontibacterium sp. N1Y112]|uniref:EAL domain-containing protein n=1 Tax=Pontibacterium sinense TaxID=2781979 RepID=A0A8J7K726_9GAMM|nr:GGDEF and EAL domain-containing protein [Pontibacterium sinense]MBE9397766.1 EAL domain-containing protein [Pontibacterium sinense]
MKFRLSDPAPYKIPSEHQLSYRPAIKIAALYCLFSILWVILSDRAIEALTSDLESLSTAQTYKGLFFIVITTLLVFWLVRRSIRFHQKSLAYQRTLVETIPDLVWLKATDGTYIACNSKFERFFGAKEADIVGKTDYDFVDKDLADLFRENDLLAINMRGPHSNEEVVTYADDGHQETLETIKTPLYDPKGNVIGILGVSRDITERKQQEERIRHQAHFDSLTNLPNRFLAQHQLEQFVSTASRHKHRVAVIYLDLDDFKKINDSLGHATGDKLLIEASKRLRGAVRQGDTVGRLGGDEFIVLLDNINSADDVAPIAENLINCFRHPFSIDGRALLLTATAGIAIYPEDGEDRLDLLRSADSAMYHAKEAGRNTFAFFTSAMNRDVSRRLLLEEQMHGALARDEFRVCYQPKIDVKSGEITGFEALLRWRNPTLGDVSPGEFIPVAEHTGLILPLGEFVLQEALATGAAWYNEFHRELSMAVNLSPRQFRDPNLINHIKQRIAKSGFPQHCLELEITEGVLMSGHGFIETALDELTDAGIIIAMDDFGTGYSSLSYLRNYPFDVLKIDQSFVRDITHDHADLELVCAAITMAHNLGLSVIAEGVETTEQLDLLATHDCDSAQGYLISRPMEQEDAKQMLEERQTYTLS